MPHFMRQVTESYRLTFIFIISAFPLLCLPIFFEGLQHIAEVKLGMFAATGLEDFGDEAQRKRLVFGVFKVFSLLAMTIFLPRYFIHGRDLKRSLSFSSKALRAVIIGCVFMAALMLWMFLLGPWIFGLLIENASMKQKYLWPLIAGILICFPLQTRTNAWMAAVFDDKPLSMQENQNLKKAMMGMMAPVILIPILPLMALHYFLNLQSMGQPLNVLWGLLTLDSLIVGVLATLMGASFYVVYRDARASA